MYRLLSVKRNHRKGTPRAVGTASLHRRTCFEALESRHLLSIALPTIGEQALTSGAPLNLAINGSSSLGNPVNYTVSVSNVSLTNSTVSNPQLTTTLTSGNPSLRLTIADAADGINDEVVLQLFEDLSPKTVDKIMSLVNGGFYDGLTFHRVIDNFMIQGGDPDGNGTGGPDYRFDDEFNADLQFTGAGLLAMANSGSDTNGSQFFITVAPYRQGDFTYSIFGMLTEGSGTVDAISRVPTNSSDKPNNNVVITDASIFDDTQNGVLRLSAPNGTTGTAEVTITATDSVTDETVIRMFRVTVAADTTNNAPFLQDMGPITTTANTPVSFDILAVDVESDAMEFNAGIAPDGTHPNLGLTMDYATGHVTLTPANNAPGVFSMIVGVEVPESESWDMQALPVYVNPAAPTGITLMPASDTGSSNTDGVTDLNNTAGKTLQFQVNGVVSGAMVRLFAGDLLIGEAVASGTSVTVTTNGTATLPEGANSIAAKQTLEDQAVNVGNLQTTVDLASAASSALTITIDTPNAPVLVAANPVLGPTDENTATTFNLTTFINNGSGTTTITDEDEGAVVGGIAVVATTGNGTWAFSSDGVTFAPLGAVSQSSAFMLAHDAVLRYTPDGENGETAALTYRAWDTTGGEEGLRVDLTSAGATGGSTPFSTTTDTATLSVTDVNDAPVLTASNPSLGSITPDASRTFALATVIDSGAGTTTIIDVDRDAEPVGIALTGVVGNGIWEYSLNGTDFSPVGTVTDDAALLLSLDATLRYTPVGTNSESASITYRGWDVTVGEGGNRVDATVNGGIAAFSAAADTALLIVNNAPSLAPGNPALETTNEDAARTVNIATLINNGNTTTTIADLNENATLGGIAVVATTGNGTGAFSLDGVNFTPIGTVSQSSALLLPYDAVLRYTPDGENGESVGMTYRAWDATSGQSGQRLDTTTNGGATAFSIATDTASLTVTSLNDAPVIAVAAPSLGNTTSNVTKTIDVATFINNGAGTTTVTDVDSGAVLGGIAVVGLTNITPWEYSLDGTTFTPIGTVSESAALLLPSTAKLRYTPDSSSTETATVTFRAWDTTSGQNGARVDTTTNGGTTAFSIAMDTAGLTVTTPNSAPVLTPVSPSLGSTLPADAKTVALADFINHGTGTTTITDADEDAVEGGIAVIGVTGNGNWEYSLNGTDFSPVGTVTDDAALLLSNDATLRYIPSSTDGATATIAYRAWDATVGENGARVDATISGGATAFSSATDTASLTIADGIAGGSISGFAYVDADNDGLRIIPNDGRAHLALPGVVVKLFLKNGNDTWTEVAGKSPILTAADGSYRFTDLVAGTYRVEAVQPVKFLDGKETVGTVGGVAKGTASQDRFEIQLGAGETARDYNFGERGLRPQYISIRCCMASAPSGAQRIIELNGLPEIRLATTAAVAGTRATFEAGGPAILVAPDATVIDVDSPMLAWMRVTLVSLWDGTSEGLAVDTSNTAIGSTYADGVLELTGVADPAAYQRVLRSLNYSNTASFPTGGDRTIEVVVNDGIASSEPATTTIAMELAAVDAAFAQLGELLSA